MAKTKKKQGEFATHLLDENTPFAVREAFNQLRTNLMYTNTEHREGCPIFAITSADEGEGKSNIVANLAYSFAQVSKKVLLIEGDLRLPTQHRIFGLDRQSIGLSELIAGIETDATQKDVRPNLDIILSGRIPPNPAELINSPNFVELLRKYSMEYDIIFIDFPPIGIVADAASVSKDITGYLFAVRSGRDSAKKVRASIDALEQVGAKIAGIVLNDITLRGVGRHYYKSKYTKYSKYAASTSRYEASAKEALKNAEDKEK